MRTAKPATSACLIDTRAGARHSRVRRREIGESGMGWSRRPDYRFKPAGSAAGRGQVRARHIAQETDVIPIAIANDDRDIDGSKHRGVTAIAAKTDRENPIVAAGEKQRGQEPNRGRRTGRSEAEPFPTVVRSAFGHIVEVCRRNMQVVPPIADKRFNQAERTLHLADVGSVRLADQHQWHLRRNERRHHFGRKLAGPRPALAQQSFDACEDDEHRRLHPATIRDASRRPPSGSHGIGQMMAPGRSRSAQYRVEGMAQAAAVPYAAHMPRRTPTHPHRLAHEQTIIDEWIEDDGVYVTLRTASPAGPGNDASAGAAELAPPDSPAPAASPRPPTLR